MVENLRLNDTNSLLLDTGQALNVNVTMVDQRKLSDQQRKFIFALCQNIGDWIGEDREYIRLIMMETVRRLGEVSKESLTEYTMTDGNKLIDTIIDFSLQQGITLGNLAQEYKYTFSERQAYAMALQRVCCICGRKGADIHHVDHIGTRGNRNKVSHIGLRALPLCRIHHTEAHSKGTEAFLKAYHLDPFTIDKKMEYFIKKGKIKEFKDEQ
ncbi:MAG: DUF968 domain-containing protein [Erysipelotrichaceae bacterium]|nr:DUF968 domain-containing protein [Erysipelotrichaceae bacterium]